MNYKIIQKQRERETRGCIYKSSGGTPGRTHEKDTLIQFKSRLTFHNYPLVALPIINSVVVNTRPATDSDVFSSTGTMQPPRIDGDQDIIGRRSDASLFSLSPASTTTRLARGVSGTSASMYAIQFKQPSEMKDG